MSYKFARRDIQIYNDLQPIDMNDPASASSAIEYSLPTGFSNKAKACWQYFSGCAFLFEYKGTLVVTDESLYLTAHGDGTPEAPIGFPRWECDTWEELEQTLEDTYDELVGYGEVEAWTEG